MQHNMNLFKEPFDMISTGNKSYELRLYDEKRQKIKAGDTIVFTSLVNSETIKTIVLSVNVFESFNELYRKLPMNKCGYKQNEIPDPNDMLEYYSKEQQEKYKAVSIEIKLI